MMELNLQQFKTSVVFVLGFSMLLLLFSCGKEKKSNRAGEKMQQFIVDISNYSRSVSPGFIIIPQNGEELAFNNLDAEKGLKQNFMNAIDGFGIEELFYDGTLKVDDYRLDLCRKIAAEKKIMVADYLQDAGNYDNAWSRCDDNGFIGFPRVPANYDYMQIPDVVHHENSANVNTLKDAKNYLYLISSNAFISKQEMLNAIIATNFDAVIIDAFFNNELWSATEINQMKTKANGGKRLIISYMSIGSAEKYRYYWKEDWKLHKPKWLKKAYEGYEDEIWVKFWKKEWQDIIFGNDNSYLKKILDANFDGTYLDNVEVFYTLYHND